MNAPNDAIVPSEREDGVASDHVERDALASSPRPERHDNDERHLQAERNDPMEASERRSIEDEGNDAFDSGGPSLASEPALHRDDHDHNHDHSQSSEQIANERNSDEVRE